MPDTLHILPKFRVQTAIDQAQKMALGLGLSAATGEQIASRVLEIIEKGSRRYGELCPKCGQLLGKEGEGKICPEHGTSLGQRHKAILVAFDPMSPESLAKRKNPKVRDG